MNVGEKTREVLCIVHGEVQGVSFRAFLKEKAAECGVSGTARNLPDGTVEVVAQGAENDVRKFLDFVYSGPADAAVDNVNVSWGPALEKITGFSIDFSL